MGRSYPVHRPSISFLEVVESAYENKNRGGFIDRWRKGVERGKEKIYFPLLRARFARVLVDFGKEKAYKVCLQARQKCASILPQIQMFHRSEGLWFSYAQWTATGAGNQEEVVL